MERDRMDEKDVLIILSFVGLVEHKKPYSFISIHIFLERLVFIVRTKPFQFSK